MSIISKHPDISHRNTHDLLTLRSDLLGLGSLLIEVATSA